MPLTRARQQAVESTMSSSDAEDSSHGFALKQRLTRSTTQQSLHQPSESNVKARFPSQKADTAAEDAKSRTTFKRFASSPAFLADTMVGSTSSHAISSGNTKGAKSSPSTSTRSKAALRRTSLGPRRQRKSTGHDSDSSDDEGRPPSTRFGGCQSDPDPRDVRDDSNKENIAPMRTVSEAILMAEAREVQNEQIARRTRGRSSITARQPSSSASSVSSENTAPSLRPRTRTISSRRSNAGDSGKCR